MTTIYISTIHILIASSFSDKMTITIVLICNKKKSICIAIIANRVWCDSFNNTMYSTTTTSYWSCHVYTVFPQGKYSYRERCGDVLTRLKMGFVELRQKYPSSSNNGALGCFVQNDLVNCVIHCSQCIYYLNGWVLLYLHCQRFFAVFCFFCVSIFLLYYMAICKLPFICFSEACIQLWKINKTREMNWLVTVHSSNIPTRGNFWWVTRFFS